MSMDANQPLSLVKNEVQDYDTGRFTEVEDEQDDDDSSDSSGLGGGIHRIIHEPPVEITDDEVRQIRRICDNHDRNYRSVAFGEELIKELVMCSVFKFPLSTSAAMTAYRLMIQRVTKVAQGFDTFIDFPHQTQKALLKQNADLLVSLRGAVFFEDKKKGLDQILYSMGVDDIDVGKKMIMTTMKAAGDLGRIDYQNYNSIQKLGDETTENRYNQLLSRVGATVSLTPELVKLLSYVVLLSPDFCELVGEDRKRVERVQDMMVNMLKRFIFSKYSRPVAVNVFARALTCIGDLREMSNIKKQRALAKPIDPDQAASGSQPAAVATADAQLVDDRETDGQSPAPSFYTTH